MKLMAIFADINPILRILLIVVLSVVAHFFVKAIRRFSQYLLTMKVDSETASEANLTRRYPKIATIITILAAPEIFGIKDSKAGQWRYLRIKFKLWPGQIKIVEETFKEMVVQVLKKSYTDYAAWMITLTYKVE